MRFISQVRRGAVSSVFGAAVFGLAGMCSGTAALAQDQIKIDADDIGGVVSGPKGPEAGVWVIAETTGLPTKFAKIVVTDDKGRYVLPDLPKASYSVWVRGYGLVDSAKVTSQPGKQVNLAATAAPNAQAAAQYYPAIYWFSMLKIPEKGLFPGTGSKGNGVPESLKDQAQYLRILKTDGCVTCHQLGNKLTRGIEPELQKYGPFDSSAAAWERRLQSGQASSYMVRNIGNLDTQRALQNFGEWTDEINKGAVPFAQPARPTGTERNVVLTMWDWMDAKTYVHDEIATDKRNPTINGYGLIYGSPEESTDKLPILDPVKNIVSHIDLPVRDPKTHSTKTELPAFAPSPYWGEELIWDSKTNVHNPMMDEKGRVWYTSRIRNNNDNPAFCKEGSANAFAKAFPTKTSGRQVGMYDPKTKKFTLIDTCFGTHHLQFADDKDNTLWFSGGGNPTVGWINRRLLDETGDEEKSQGWTPFILDTNGNGKRDETYVKAADPLDPTKDKQIAASFYGASPMVGQPGVAWGSVLGFPGGIARMELGSDPARTAKAEYYELPWKDEKAKVWGYGPRGMDIDKKGVVWAPLASGHLASFDRAKCKVLNGPTATGKHCPEGWTLYPMPGPQFKSITDSGSAEAPYYTWVDQHNTLGLGDDVPLATANQSDALVVFEKDKFITMRVPYPMGFFAKGLDGRIDDAKAGWKGRGVWSAYATRANWHTEGGKGTLGKVVHFQIRPNPLAK